MREDEQDEIFLRNLLHYKAPFSHFDFPSARRSLESGRLEKEEIVDFFTIEFTDKQLRCRSTQTSWATRHRSDVRDVAI